MEPFKGERGLGEAQNRVGSAGLGHLKCEISGREGREERNSPCGLLSGLLRGSWWLCWQGLSASISAL